MHEIYPVTISGVQVGTATISKEGLYANIECKCVFQNQGFYRIHMHIGAERVDLGTCVPQKEHYIVKKRLPLKDVLGKEIAFSVYDPNGRKTLWQSGDPQLSVAMLPWAKLEVVGNKTRLVTDRSPDPQDSGQNP